MIKEQDLAPQKPATDVIIRATARSFDRKPRSDWPVSISIRDRLRYEFQVRGPSLWQHRRLGGWTLSQPEFVHEVPLSYTLSYGGYVLNGDDDKVAYEFNPSGLGFATSESLKNGKAFSAPQIGLLGNFMVADPLTPMSVEGFGPIAKTWLPRRSEAGTFDADWQRDRHPRMPTDYSLSFWNAAHGSLQVDPYLSGAETISIDGVSFDHPTIHVPLPQVGLLARFSGSYIGDLAITLDTVVVDVTGENPDGHILDLTWRCRLDDPSIFTTVQISSQRLEG
ncbi:DUF2169 domain-containing protein [Nereida sp. MMG025]|uniref:DUF2169 domain-containing protein n=1 Tax=Nereida sp. MMG025 TaxID=2909981 RepID=UPI001F1C9704|nr:DUF2169 domain-containing protein [Nereida sp. MMG025]MCF6446082.1 DUF2169 domain-containing protein [Nereida sp. MMG025]